MQFLTNSKIDFMKYRKVFVWVSVALLAVAVSELFFYRGLNLGIDFTGGTQLQLRFKDQPDTQQISRVLEDAGIRGAVVQRFGTVEEKEVLIRTPVVADSEEGNSGQLQDAINAALNPGDLDKDLNWRGAGSVANLLNQFDPDGRLAAGDDEVEQLAYYHEVAKKVLGVRKDVKMIEDFGQLEGIDGVSAGAVSTLRENATLGNITVQSIENVGPQIGGELSRKGILAVVMSLIGMLLYIWFRFELRFGIGALVAVFHDFLIVLGLYALAGFEFNLPTIAAFLTLVGYSVNDTVVIFDRVRENMRRFRREPLINIMNMSLNQTLARTILTSGTTLLAVGSLFFLGGEALRGFSFVLLIGVLVGTYSSIFVASPFALLWEQFFGRDARERREARAKSQATA